MTNISKNFNSNISNDTYHIDKVKNLEIIQANSPEEYSDVSKIIKTMISRRSERKIEEKPRKSYSICDKMEFNNLTGNITYKIENLHIYKFDLVVDVIESLEEFETEIRSELFEYYWSIYLEVLDKFSIDLKDYAKIREHSSKIYLEIQQYIESDLYSLKNCNIAKNKLKTYSEAITAFVFYSCKFLLPVSE
ncbi:hypothetical protein [Peptacetobacter hiranonis]|uniref:Uncharacterized protein n=1 Tax=Peptacetobacter hiranonis (strain DSM 13275 / JCM 10541 / KCTC 15199 / TO-931) TaxID=500633 RepID=B6FWT6_PEPHT|nr:hypothetical protein [Peptacetobacter hiranonis]EEA85997.1 hypothetical protein CLOHIR_00335 [Peptacetobacter hiranonis DSM 13275]QEK21116.1 hypothetical protein KGNDJEFE_01603 [Peptacetobacter hiranonis]